MKKMCVDINLIGLGTVGRGVYELITNKNKEINEKTGLEIGIYGVCEKNKKILKEINISQNIKIIDIKSASKRCDIVVELIGGLDTAYDIVSNALNNKKYVVTANKALLAERGEELFDLAFKNDVEIRYEASVAGGIPILKSIREGLIANDITEIYGIINGTTNYILTRMEKEEMDFDKALKLAQNNGFAEADPSLDINGIDSAHKAVLLGGLVYQSIIPFNDVYIEGISNITLQDIKYAFEMGFRVKLIATIKRIVDKIDIRVHPALVPINHPLSNIPDEYNGIFLKGDAVSEQLYYGKGAGRYPAASAVVADVVDLAKKIVYREKLPKNIKKRYIKKAVFAVDDIYCSYFLKFITLDRPLVLAKISRILGINDVSIASVIQKEVNNPKGVPIVILTHKANERRVKEALKEIDKLSIIKAKSSLIRILE
ncbi:MAG: homoserine dehydrogenase [Candidatus Hydrogenedentota bacterium]